MTVPLKVNIGSFMTEWVSELQIVRSTASERDTSLLDDVDNRTHTLLSADYFHHRMGFVFS